MKKKIAIIFLIGISLSLSFIAMIFWNQNRANALHSKFLEYEDLPDISIREHAELDRETKEDLFEITKMLVSTKGHGKVKGKILPEYEILFVGFSSTQNTYEMHVYMFGLIHFIEYSPDGTELHSSTYRRSRDRRVAAIIDFFNEFRKEKRKKM